MAQKTYILLSLATIFWGIQPLCIKVLLHSWNPVALSGLRYLFISIILFILIYLKDKRMVFPPSLCIRSLILMGFTGIAINNIAQFTGLQYSTITNCTLIAATGPAITSVISFILIHERLQLLQWLGIIISFFGVIFLISNGSSSIFFQLQFNNGDILFFLCQIVWALYSILGLKVMNKLSAIVATAWSGFFGAIEILFFALYTDQLHYTPLDFSGYATFSFIVLFGGVGSMLFWNIGVKNAGPSIASIFANLTPIFGIFCGNIALNEPVGYIQLFGALTIFIGVYITTHYLQIQKLFIN